MSKNTTIKISKKTLERLHRIVGELTYKKGQRVILEEAITFLLERYEQGSRNSLELIRDIEMDRKAFFSLLNQKYSGAGPEDYKEYDYEDISG